MMQIQVTLFDVTGKYRPLSTTVKVESYEWYLSNKSKVHVRAIQRICAAKCKTWAELKADGYQKMKARIYQPKTGKVNNAVAPTK